MKTLSKNKKLAIAICAVMIISILAVSIGLIVYAVEKSRTVVADTDDGQLLSGKVYDMPKQLTLMADTATAGVNLKVTLKPASSTAKINFALKWKDSTIEDDVNTFILLTTVNDTQCNIKRTQGFENQIMLVASVANNPLITASCVVDCYIVLESMTVNITCHDSDTKNYILEYNGKLNFEGNTPIFNLNYTNDTHISATCDYKFAKGTKNQYKSLIFEFRNMIGDFTDSNNGIPIGNKLSCIKLAILEGKEGTIALESKPFNLNYFWDNEIWTEEVYGSVLDTNSELPPFINTKDFYVENIHVMLDHMGIDLGVYGLKNNEIQPTFISGIVFEMNINYLYEIKIDDSVIVE